MKSLLFALFLVSIPLMAEATPNIPCTYRIISEKAIYQTMVLKNNGTADLVSRAGTPITLRWTLRGNLFIIEAVGYYVSWRHKNGIWTLILTPATDVMAGPVIAVKEF